MAAAPSDRTLLAGGCHCRAVRYAIEAEPYDATLCHCTDCRGTSGAPAVAWFSVRRSGFRWLQGSPTRYRSSAAATRTFCPACGAQLTFEQDGSGEVGVTTCSLDDPDAVPPADHTYVRSRPAWAEDLQQLPAHLATRPV